MTYEARSDMRNPISALKALRAAPPGPPHELSNRERKVWDEIIAARAPAEWVGIDDRIAWILVQTLVAYEDELYQLQAEGYVLAGARGGLQINPRHMVVANLRAAVLTYQSRLRLSLEDGSASDKTRCAARKADQQRQQIEDTVKDSDELIPRGRLQAPIPGEPVSHVTRNQFSRNV